MKSFASIVTNCFLKPIRKAKLSSIWRAQKFCFNIKHHHQRQERIWWRLPLYFVVFHSVIMALVELSFPIKRQELSNNSRIKEDSKIALTKKRRSGFWVVQNGSEVQKSPGQAGIDRVLKSSFNTFWNFSKHMFFQAFFSLSKRPWKNRFFALLTSNLF